MATLCASGYEIGGFPGGSLIRYSQFAGQSFVAPCYFGTLASLIILNCGWISLRFHCWLCGLRARLLLFVSLPCRLQQLCVGGFACYEYYLSPSLSVIPFSLAIMRCTSALQPNAYRFQLVPIEIAVFCFTSAEAKYKRILVCTLWP